MSSGSHGNSIVLDNGTTKLAIDFGVKTFKLWKELAASTGIKVEDLDAVLITHAHGDHIKSLNAFIAVHGNEKVYTTAKVANDISRTSYVSRFNLSKVRTIPFGSWVEVGDFRVTPIKMNHPGNSQSAIAECVGYHIKDLANNKQYVYATDTTTLKNVIIPSEGFDLLMLESNYDEDLEMQVFNNAEQSPAVVARHIGTVRNHLPHHVTTAWILRHNELFKEAKYILLHESQSNKYDYQIYKQLNEYPYVNEYFKGE